MDLLFDDIPDISMRFRYLQSITLSAPFKVIEWVVPQMSNLRSLNVRIGGFSRCADFSFLQSCSRIESLSICGSDLEPNQCKQFSNLKNLTKIDLRGTCLTSEAMLSIFTGDTSTFPTQVGRSDVSFRCCC